MTNAHKLEVSLKEFIIDEQSDAHNIRNINFYKYNNLRLFMDPVKIAIPHFFVRIGISEACYRLSDCEKLSGGLGADAKYIPRWYNRVNIKEELSSLWTNSLKIKVVINDTEEEPD